MNIKSIFRISVISVIISINLSVSSLTFASNDVERVIVQFKPGKSDLGLQQALASGAVLERALLAHDAIAISIPANAIKGLANNPNVEFVEPDAKRYPYSQTQPYGIQMVQANLVSDLNAGNRKVCIIDSGYQISHEDLSSNMVSGTNDSGTGNWYTDENHHGTHVAGTIAAFNNDKGVIGILPNGYIQLHIIKVFGADAWAYSSDLIAALDACQTAGANVVSMSLGGTFKSRFEDRAFKAANDSGILSVAAAGNDGNNRNSYPASYSSVLSVAAIDKDQQVASFSQYNSQVELSAPGVGVLSTVPMGTGQKVSLTTAAGGYVAFAMEGSPQASVTGSLVDCGIGDSVCSSAAGQICLIQRGSISFSDKVLNCEAGGGIGAIIYNNVSGELLGTLGGIETSIPSVGVSDTSGNSLVQQTGLSASLAISPDNYAYFDGTSMATPHVSAAAALVWSYHEQCTNDEIRAALDATALDLGVTGKDEYYGYGLVQVKDAKQYLDTYGCAGNGEASGGGGGQGGGTCHGKKCSN